MDPIWNLPNQISIRRSHHYPRHVLFLSRSRVHGTYGIQYIYIASSWLRWRPNQKRCSYHQGGRIKLTRNGKVLHGLDTPSLGYTYDYDTPILSDFDKECGTFGLGNFQLPNNPYCPDRFVCGTDPTVDEDLHRFAQCIDAMNCHMMAGMSTRASSTRAALFVHQMIPHHQNAVNMAKALNKPTFTIFSPFIPPLHFY